MFITGITVIPSSVSDSYQTELYLSCIVVSLFLEFLTYLILSITIIASLIRQHAYNRLAYQTPSQIV